MISAAWTGNSCFCHIHSESIGVYPAWDFSGRNKKEVIVVESNFRLFRNCLLSYSTWNKSHFSTIYSRYFASLGYGNLLVFLFCLWRPYSVQWLLNTCLRMSICTSTWGAVFYFSKCYALNILYKWKFWKGNYCKSKNMMFIGIM